MTLDEFNGLLKDFENDDLEFRQDIGRAGADVDKDRDVKTTVAFYNTKGGRLVFGIREDGKERKVVGLEKPQVIENNLVSKLEAKADLDVYPRFEFIEIGGMSCVIVHCPRGAQAPYHADGKIYVRRGANTVEATSSEIAGLYRDRNTSSYDRTICDDASISDLDKNAIKAYLQERGGSQILDGDFENLICRIGLAGKADDGTVKPTIAGLLLFGNSPQDFFPHAMVKAEAKFDEQQEGWDDIEEIKGTIFQQIKGVEQFLKRNISVSAKIVGFERVERRLLPIEALREAIVNALVHRDYGISGAEIFCRVKTDRVSIENPGGLIAPLTLVEVLSGDFIPKTRNAVIALVLGDKGLMDKRGSGFVRISRLMEQQKYGAFEAEELTQGFRVNFTALTGQSDENNKIFIPDEIIRKAKLEPEHKKILTLIENKGRISSQECMQLLGKSKPTVLDRINYLLEKELIERTSASPFDPEVGYTIHSRFTQKIVNPPQMNAPVDKNKGPTLF